MNITEKAKQYAKGKAMEAITTAIEQAYADGYNDGLKHLENEQLEAVKDGVEYVDLGLKKGTLWSSGYIKYDAGRTNRMPYMEASKLNLPTKEQFEELCRECFAEHREVYKFSGIIFTGINGGSIRIGYSRHDIIALDCNSFIFWLKDDEDSVEKLAAYVKIENNKATPLFTKVFMGLQLPVMLVK